MSITIKGSSFYFSSQIEAENAQLSNFFEWIRAHDNCDWPYSKKIEKPAFTRKIYVDGNEKYFIGLFISSKTNEFHHFVKEDNGKVTIEAKSVNGNPPVEINFFCIRKDSMKGIYSHYMSSYAFMQFLKDTWMEYQSFVRLLSKEAELADDSIDFKKTYKINNFNKYGPLFTPGNFQELIEKVKSISEVRATSYELEGAASHNESVSRKFKSVHQTFRLEGESDSGVVAWIKALRKKTKRHLKSGNVIYSGSVLGLNEEDEPVTISFTNTMDDYLGFDYDDLGTFDSDDLFSHDLVKEMMNQLNSKLVFKPQEIE